MEKRKWTIALALICIVSLSCNVLLLIWARNRNGAETGDTNETDTEEQSETPVNWTLESWRSSLKAMDVDADVAFFGDSITKNGAWAEAFPDVRIVNLGLSGDSVSGMTSRVDMIASVKAEKVFILGGINSLKGSNSAEILEQYQNMLESVHEAVPDAQIYVQSVLPISAEKEEVCTDNLVIVSFNAEIEKLAEEAGATYINIHDLYELDGLMDPNLTKDGIHLKPEAYDRWYQAIEEYVYD